MKKLLLGASALVAVVSITPASAADLAARPYTKAPALPMVAAIYDWSGFYIGANGGWGNQRNCFTSVAPALLGAEGCHDADGGVAGGQIGYRWQSAAWVFGLEAQGDWADLRGSNESLLFPGFTNRSEMRAFGLFTGQIGWAWNSALLYVKGGAAVTDNRHTIIDDATGFVAGRSDDDIRWGATVGVGLEYGFAANWTAGVEYDHIFMGDRSATFLDNGGVFFGSDRISGDVDLVTVRVNYRFGGPMIGRY